MCKVELSTGGDHLYMSPASMAKLGYLYLHKGEWDGQQLVSSDWISQVTSEIMKVGHSTLDGVGYFWQSGLVLGTEHRAYAVTGVTGGAIWVVADFDLVVVTTNDLASSSQTIITAVVKAISSDQPLPANPDAAKALQSRIDELAHPQATAVKPIPDAMKAASGKVYQLQPNDFGWKSISFDFAKPDEGLIIVGLPDKEIKLPMGLDNVYRLSTDSLPAEPVWRPIANVPQMLKGGFLGKRLIVSMGDCMGMEFWMLNIDVSKDGSKLWISALSTNEDNAMLPSHDLVGTS